MAKKKLGSIPLGSSADPIPMPVDNKTLVSISRVNGKTGKVEEVATGRINMEDLRWYFHGSEPATVSWLEKVFNNPPQTGRQKYGINTETFLVYIMSTLMPRKGLEMDWKKDSKQPEDSKK